MIFFVLMGEYGAVGKVCADPAALGEGLPEAFAFALLLQCSLQLLYPGGIAFSIAPRAPFMPCKYWGGRMGNSIQSGIVLRYANYRDYDRMLTLFTREAGLLSVCARGCRRPKSPLAAAGEAFVYGEFSIFEGRGGKRMLDSFSCLESFYPIREDIARLAGGSCMLRLVEKSGVTEGAEALFSCLYYALSYLCYAPVEPIDITLCFFVRALSLLGLQPALTQCCVCGRDLRADKELRFHAGRGGAACLRCAFDAVPVQPLSLEAMRRMLLLSDEDMRKVRLPGVVREELKKIIRDFASRAMEYDFKAFDQM